MKTPEQWSRQIAAKLASDRKHIPAIMSQLPIKEIQLEAFKAGILYTINQIPVGVKDCVEQLTTLPPKVYKL